MFSGISKGIGLIFYVKNYETYKTIGIKIPKTLLFNLKIGDSILNNGCCLTIKNIINNFLYFEVINETIKVSNFNNVCVNNLVNIERSVKLIDEISGHILSGHIVSLIKLIYFKNNRFWFKYKNKNLIKYILYKGFVGINGISLTINFIYKNIFCINIIKETFKKTTFIYIKKWNFLNLEIDYYIQIMINNTFNNNLKHVIKK